ncbi:hypothetical protein VP01_10345g1 [Puccinia sorghi]|uniref:Uncharacterized protein n=1 Tax=Puccinia sorghi TaxID=27349 RepID=A0A0L6VUJ0_9BASI|nr:hypothetical protein VP01_10345g1 [Puccinia sorghi]
MMQFISSNQIQLTHPRLIKTTINFQHNCHAGHCQKKISSRPPDKNYEGPQVEYLMEHTSIKNYILNTGSFHSSLELCLMASITTDPPTPHQNISAVINSTQRWQDETSRSANLNSLEESETYQKCSNS